jgi:hypothetical protein
MGSSVSGSLAGASVAHLAPRCAPGSIAIALGSTGLDASHVNAYLVFTNHEVCTLQSSTYVSSVVAGSGR